MEGRWRDELMRDSVTLELTMPSNGDDNSSYFHCSHCGRQYLLKKTLRRHMLYDCGTKPRFSCSMCGLRVRRRYILTRHLVEVHRVQKEQAECSVPLLFHRKKKVAHSLWSRSIVKTYNHHYYTSALPISMDKGKNCFLKTGVLNSFLNQMTIII
jgi:hypothetical protein